MLTANPLTGKMASSADQVIAGATAVPLSQLAAGPNGIMVTAHPNNGATVIRVSGSDAAAGQGQPLAAGASTVFNVTNAGLLSAIVEGGSGTLCVSAV